MKNVQVLLSDVVNYSLKIGDNINHADIYGTKKYNIQSYFIQNEKEYTTIAILDNVIIKFLEDVDRLPILYNNIARLEKWKLHISNMLINKSIE